jgi:uncharacterized membrane protein
VTVKDDDGYPLETIGLSITVDPSYDIDIADNAQNLVGNVMTIGAEDGDTAAGVFQLINPDNDAMNVDPDPFGNATVSGLGANLTDLEHADGYVIPSSNIDFPNSPNFLNSGDYADIIAQVAIPAGQHEGMYTGVIEIFCSQGPSDSFMIQVVVGPLEDIVLVGTLDDTVNHGNIAIDTFTVANVGNAELDNLLFEVTNLGDGLGHSIPDDNVTFVPTSIETLEVGESTDVTVDVFVPLGMYAGTYGGVVTVKDDDGYPQATMPVSVTVLPSYDLDIAEAQVDLGSGSMEDTLDGTFRLVNPNSEATNVDPDPFGNADLADLDWTVTDLGYVGEFSRALELERTIKGLGKGALAIDSLIPAASVDVTLPAGLGSGEGEDVPVGVAIPVDVLAGVYEGTLTVTDTVAGVSDEFDLIVAVRADRDLAIPEDVVSDTADHGESIDMWFTVENLGNVDLNDIEFENTVFADTITYEMIPEANVSYVPPTIATLPVDMDSSIMAIVSVPPGQYTGDYVCMVVATDGMVSDSLLLELHVAAEYDFDIAEATVDLGAGDMGETLESTFRAVNPNSEATNVDPDPFGNDDLEALDWSATDLMYMGDAAARIIERREAIERQAGGDLSRVAHRIAQLEDIDTIIGSGNVDVVLAAFLASGDGVDAPVSVDLPMDVLAGTYYGWVHVEDGGTAVSDSFRLMVTVNAEADINIVEDDVSDAVTHGELAQLTFTVENLGNVDLNDVQFEAINLEDGTGNIIPDYMVSFDPPMVAEIPYDGSVDVMAVVDVPAGTYNGTYVGMAWATDGTVSDSVGLTVNVTPTFDLDIAEVMVDLGLGYMGDELEGTFRMVNPNSEATNVDPDPFGNADLTNLEYTVTDLEFIGDIVAARRERMRRLQSLAGEGGMAQIMAVDSVIPAENVTLTIPEGLESGFGDDYPVSVLLPSEDMLAGTYEGTVMVLDQQCGGVSDEFKLVVAIEREEDLSIVEETLTDRVGHGMTAAMSFTVENVGNADLENIVFESSNLYQGELGSDDLIPDYNISFTPPSLALLEVEGTAQVTVEVVVELGTLAGDYTGIVTATSQAVSDTVGVVLTVDASYDLDIADNEGNLVENTMHMVGAMGDTAAPFFFYLVNPNSEAMNKDPDAFGNAPLTAINYQVTALISGDGYTLDAETVTLLDLPVTLSSGGSANVGVQVVIPADQHAGVYAGTVTVLDETQEVQDHFTLMVMVQPEMELFFAVDTLGFQGTAGDFADVDIVVKNGSNATIWGMEIFAITDLVSGSFARIPRTEIIFTPPVLDTMGVDDSTMVNVGVQIPDGMTRGNYYGSIEVRDDVGAPFDTLVLMLTVSSEEAVAFSDNPVTGDWVEIGYYGEPGYEPRLTIVNMAAEMVLQERLEPIPATGADSYTWDLKNEAGKDVASGLYIVMVETKIDGEETVVRRKLLVIR